MSDDPIYNQEEQKLKEVIAEVEDAQIGLENSIRAIGAVTLGELQSLRENPEGGMDLIESLQRIQEKNQAFNLMDKYARLEEMAYLKKEPYFSRIDLADKGTNNPTPYYIGKFGYISGNEPLVTDWRAKVASIFYRYRYPQRDVKYDAPDGTITKDLVLKRTFEIDNSELVKYYNNDIQFDENEIIVDKINQRTGGVLEDIIETIQEGQLDIIESDPRQVCIVQGTVGSGKSTVAIHKLSHIFFNFPKLIRANRSILIAKNQILVSYLSTLFPKLGIFDINFKTVKDLAIRIAFQEGLKLELDFDENYNNSNVTLEYVQKLRNDIKKIHEEYATKIEKFFEKDEFSTFAGYVYSQNQPVHENIIELINEMNEEIDIQRSYLEEPLSSLRRELHKQNIKTIKKIVGGLRRIAGELSSTALPRLLKDYGLNTSKKITYKESLLYLVIHYELFGFSKFQKYEYCVVDEGQDFSVLEYLFLGKIVLNGRFCILGDLNQSYQEEGLLDWSVLSEVVDEATSANTFELDTNYRSTKQIIDFANGVLSPYTNDYLPKPINRMGPEPEVLEHTSSADALATLKNKLLEDVADLNKSIGIICFTKDYYHEAEVILDKLNLDKDKLIKLDSKYGINYQPKAVYLTMFEDCKGLEFSTVYVLGLNLGKVKTFSDAKKAFVAITRAMNNVVLLSG